MSRRGSGFRVGALVLVMAVGLPTGAVATITQPVTPGLVDFGTVMVNATSAPKQVSYTNLWGDAATLTLELGGPDAAEFAIADDTCREAVVPSGASCTVDITFTPTADLVRTATLLIRDARADSSTVALRGTGFLPPARISWGPYTQVGPDDAAIFSGTGLTQTVSGTDAYLHTVYESPTRWSPAPRRLNYARSEDDGASWSSGVRLSPLNHDIDSPVGIASAGSYVYAAWTTEGGVWFRSNARHGTGSWNSIQRIGPLPLSPPSIASAGSHVYVTYTHWPSDDIRIAVSHDHGRTWKTWTLANGYFCCYSEDAGDDAPALGGPAVAASGSTVTVVWTAVETSELRSRTSHDFGATWDAETVIGCCAVARSITMRGNRTAVAWLDANAVSVRIRTGSSWGPLRRVGPSADEPHAYRLRGVAIALSPTSGVGVAFGACYECDSVDANREDVLWRESTDDGVTWTHSQVVGRATGDSRFFHSPSALWPQDLTRYVLFNRLGVDSNKVPLRLYVRSSPGAPGHPLLARS